MKSVLWISIIGAFLLLGCGNKPNPYVGKWTGTGDGVKADINFKEDGQFDYVLERTKIKIMMKGWYEQEPNRLTLNSNSVKVDGPTELAYQMEASLDRSPSMEVQWKSKTEFLIPAKDAGTDLDFKKD